LSKLLTTCQWHPLFNDVESLVVACKTHGVDALALVDAKQLERVQSLATLLPKLKETRLSGPKVNQSEYDKVGLSGTLSLSFLVHAAY
jgi:proteasome activator subunit 4